MNHPNPANRFDTHAETLHQFSLAAAEAIDELIALAPMALSIDNASVDPEMLRRYDELVQQIRCTAHDFELAGLQSMCALLENNLRRMLDGEHLFTTPECAVLSEWPELLFNYLMNGADLSSSQALLGNLCADWPECIAEECQDEELQLLMSNNTCCVAIPLAFSAKYTDAKDDTGTVHADDPFYNEVKPDAIARLSDAEEIRESGDLQDIKIVFEFDSPIVEESSAEEDISKEPDHVTDALTEINSKEPSGMAIANYLSVQPGTAVQQIEHEMISTLATELAQMEEQISADLDAAIHGADEERQFAMTNYLELLERLQLTVDSVGLTALATVFEQFRQQIQGLPTGLTIQQQVVLQQLPRAIAAYLANPTVIDTGMSLLDLLTDAVWPVPLSEESILPWLEALANVQITASLEPLTVRPTQAHSDDVSLTIADDVHPELLNGLLLELPVQVGAFSDAIEQIAQGRGGLTEIERAMRAAHTLKGAANTVGVAGIANLTHHLEDILSALLKAKKLPQPVLADMLVNASDCLEAMSEYLQGIGPAPTHALEILQTVLNCATQIDKLGVDANLPGITSTILSAVATTPATDSISPQSPSTRSANEQSLRIPAPLVDELLRLSGETLTSNSQIQEHLRQSVSQTELIHKQHRLLQQLVIELEELVDVRGITSPQLAAQKRGEDFDDLEFEHYNELHTVTRRLMEAATDAQELAGTIAGHLGSLEESLDEQQRLQMANQNAVIRIRMVTVKSVVSRLKRGVRQTARLLDKNVEFTVKGDNTSIDGNVLNDLMDPLMHILRNAVDHGIESEADRLAAGKPAAGHIELAFAREGNSIVVRCRDDGPGLDYAAILDSAERKGIILSDKDYSDTDLARLTLLPGFSTRHSTSQISGRGVGMDVVHSQVQAKKGSLVLHSTPGQGLTVELRLPATLVSTHTLIVRQRDKYLAISSRNIEDIRYCERDKIMEIGTNQYFRDDDNMYQLEKLDTLLSLPEDRRLDDMPGFPVLLARLDDGNLRAILVQEIIDSREVVMKKFGHYVPRSQGVVGAVVLGNGNIAPVIDLVELLQIPITANALATLSNEKQDSPSQALRALVVDDSLSARRAMTQVLKDAGYDVRTANDGLAAVDILSKFIPDIILSDMEMPRMNGLELAAHVRYAERTRHIPVIMITSRSTEKHRQMSTAAGVNLHIVKPYNDDALLQHVAALTAR